MGSPWRRDGGASSIWKKGSLSIFTTDVLIQQCREGCHEQSPLCFVRLAAGEQLVGEPDWRAFNSALEGMSPEWSPVFFVRTIVVADPSILVTRASDMIGGSG